MQILLKVRTSLSLQQPKTTLPSVLHDANPGGKVETAIHTSKQHGWPQRVTHV